MMAITTRSSMSVKPRRVRLFRDWDAMSATIPNSELRTPNSPPLHASIFNMNLPFLCQSNIRLAGDAGVLRPLGRIGRFDDDQALMRLLFHRLDPNDDDRRIASP